MHFHIVKMYKDKEVAGVKNFFVNVWRKSIFDIYVTEYGTALTTILPILFLYLNTVTVTAGAFGPWWEREVWRLGVWFGPPFLWRCLCQVRVITVFTVFRLLTDFVCLYNYEFWLSLCKIVRSSVILLLLLYIFYYNKKICFRYFIQWNKNTCIRLQLNLTKYTTLNLKRLIYVLA